MSTKDPIEHRVGENEDKMQMLFNILSQALPGPNLDINWPVKFFFVIGETLNIFDYLYFGIVYMFSFAMYFAYCIYMADINLLVIIIH